MFLGILVNPRSKLSYHVGRGGGYGLLGGAMVMVMVKLIGIDLDEELCKLEKSDILLSSCFR
jgi:hypothetical protein